MAYSAAPEQAIKASSLMEDNERLNARLRDIHARIEKIADLLHGSSPRDTGGNPSAPISNSMRRHVDTSHDLAAEIEAELSRVENRL